MSGYFHDKNVITKKNKKKTSKQSLNIW